MTTYVLTAMFGVICRLIVSVLVYLAVQVENFLLHPLDDFLQSSDAGGQNVTARLLLVFDGLVQTFLFVQGAILKPKYVQQAPPFYCKIRLPQTASREKID